MKLLFALLLLIGVVNGRATSYSTNFPTGEMTSGRWLQGKTNGGNWSNVANVAGLAFGTQTGNSQYDDSTAVVAGSWGNDQTAQATVSVPGNAGSVAEVELRLRTRISPGSTTGYEFNGSVSAAGGAYMQIVRWNGALASFTYLASAGVLLHSGDTLMATAKGNVLTLYKNGQAVCTASDSTFPSGAPGVGMYTNTGEFNSGYGLSSFSATDNGSATPPPTPVPTPPPTHPYAAWENSLLLEMQAVGVSTSRLQLINTWLSTHPPTP